jgi:subtilase family serine protease
MNKKIDICALVLLVFTSALSVPTAHAAGAGSMVAIIVTSHDPTLENDLETYYSQSNLPACTVTNGCLEVATPFGISNPNLSPRSDVSLYVEQTHQANPHAKILVVEAKSISWQDKWDAAYYAEKRPEVEKISSSSYSKVVMEIGLVLKQS